MKSKLLVILLISTTSYLTMPAGLAENQRENLSQEKDCINLMRNGFSEEYAKHYTEAEMLLEQAINCRNSPLMQDDLYACYNHLAQVLEDQNKLELALNTVNKHIQLLEGAGRVPSQKLFAPLSFKERILNKLGRHIEAANTAAQIESLLPTMEPIRGNIRPYADKLNGMIKNKWQSTIPECSCAIYITIARDGSIEEVEYAGDISNKKCATNCLDVVRSLHFDPLPWYRSKGIKFKIMTDKKQ